MATTTPNDSKISLKVIVDKKKNRVVYAEADDTFVDILLSFMTLPMGTIVRLLRKDPDEKFEALGSLNNLYQCLTDLPLKYLSSEECKFMLLNPRSSSFDHCRKLKLNIDDTEPVKYFKCVNGCYQNITSCDAVRCRYCQKVMNQTVEITDAGCVGGGGSVFVSDITSFIVTDDLCVMPYTSNCIIRLLKNLGITDHGIQLEERTIDVDCEKILELLKLALYLDSPLTYLVLPRTRPFRDLVHPGSFKIDQYENLIKKGKSTSSVMSIKVSLQKSTRKLLFAEVEEDFGDFIFGFLAIPLGSVIGMLMSDGSSLVCMDNIYKSILNLRVGRQIQSQDLKDILLKPRFVHGYISTKEYFPLKGAVFRQTYLTRFYPPQIGWSAISSETCSRPTCCNLCCRDTLKNPCNGRGLLKGPGMFMVTDDLVVTPLSPISTMNILNILNKLKVPLDDIEELEVTLGLEEGLSMLKSSLRSQFALTNGLKHQLKKLNQE